MAVVYFVIVLPYKRIQARRGVTVFGAEPTTKACEECLSDIPEAAQRCKYCATEQAGGGAPAHAANAVAQAR